MKCLYTAALILVSACAVFAQQQPPSDAAGAGARFFEAILNEDGAALGKLISNDFVLVSFDGQVIDGATLVEGVSGGHIVLDAANTSGNYTRTYQDTGVITGRWSVKGALQNTPFDNQLAYTVVCVRQGGSWKVASVQFTPVP